MQEEVDTPGLVVEAAAGWDGAVDRWSPVPLAFLIRNDSNQIIEATIRLDEPLTGREVTLGEVVVAPGTARRFASIQAMIEWHECVASLRVGNEVLWQRELPISTGVVFTHNINVALFIDDGGRRFDLPSAVPTAAAAQREVQVPGEEGRPVKCLTAKTWQVPNHPGPLLPAQAILFPEGANPAALNDAQWQAVAEWICQGGAVFVHQGSQEVVRRLVSAAPLSAGTAVPSGEFTIRRMGPGSIYEYRDQLLPSSGDPLRQKIAQTIARFPRRHVGSLIDLGFFQRARGGRSDQNRMLVVGFSLLYTFLVGVVSLLLFRLSQRRIAAYTITVVVAASGLAVMLGVYLRFSSGELRWISVTRGGPGGIVQVGKIEVQSAGGRNTNVAIQGEHPDLQHIEGDTRYYAWNNREVSAPFTWRPSLAANEPDACHLSVPTPPWGSRRFVATAYQRDVPPIDFRLSVKPSDPPIDREGKPVTADKAMSSYTLNVENRLPFDLTDCVVVIGATQKFPEGVQATNFDPKVMLQPQGGLVALAPQATTSGMIDVYHKHFLGELAAGAARESTFAAEFQIARNDWELAVRLPEGLLKVPRIAHHGATSAWIIGRLADSPILTIDAQRSDFVPHAGLHFFIQEIQPEDLPAGASLVP